MPCRDRKAKNALIWPEQFAQTQTSFLGERIANVYTEYQRRLAESNSLDFDDLIVRTIDLLERDKTVREKYQRKFEYVLVDEYQDVNAAQYRLVALLAAHHGNITVVGDDDQSIYSWRGSDYRMILRFEEDFRAPKVFKLEENYRSTSRILDAANALVANNRSRAPKKLFTSRASGRTDHRLSRGDRTRRSPLRRREGQEPGARGVARIATSSYSIAPTRNRASSKKRCSPKAFPIASSAASVSTPAPRSKTSSRICATSSNSSDALAFKRIVNVPRRGIGQQTLSALVQSANASRLSVGEAIFNRELLRTAVPKKLKELERFAELIANLRERAQKLGVADLLVAVMEDSGYIRELQNEDSHDARARLENLQELVGVAREYEKTDDEPSLAGFLANIALVSDLDALDDDASYVTLMTLHSAKGLEFSSVFLTGLEEGVFPHSRALAEESELEEERRLAYVGITRAIDRLFLTYAFAARALRQHVRVSEIALHRRAARRSKLLESDSVPLRASRRRPLARSSDPRIRGCGRASGAEGRRSRAPSEMGRGQDRKHRRRRRRRPGNDRLSERRPEDAHAQIRAAGKNLATLMLRVAVAGAKGAWERPRATRSYAQASIAAAWRGMPIRNARSSIPSTQMLAQRSRRGARSHDATRQRADIACGRRNAASPVVVGASGWTAEEPRCARRTPRRSAASGRCSCRTFPSARF